jgi:hypothetical protein
MTEYKKYDELKGKILAFGDVVYFQELKYEVGYRYLNDKNNYSNSLIFERLGLNKTEFCSKAYGYESDFYVHDLSSRSFPECKSYDYPALTRVVLNLFALIEGKKIKGSKIKIKPINRHLVVITSCQNFVAITNSYEEAEKLAKEKTDNLTIYKLIEVAQVQNTRQVKRIKPNKKR